MKTSRGSPGPVRTGLLAVLLALVAPSVGALAFETVYEETIDMGEFRVFEVEAEPGTWIRYGPVYEGVTSTREFVGWREFLEGPDRAIGGGGGARRPSPDATAIGVGLGREGTEWGPVSNSWLPGTRLDAEGTFRFMVMTSPAEGQARMVVMSTAPLVRLERVGAGETGYAEPATDGPASVDVVHDGTRLWAHAGHVETFESLHGLYGGGADGVFVSPTYTASRDWAFRGPPGPWVVAFPPDADDGECLNGPGCWNRPAGYLMWADVPPCPFFTACERSYG